MKTVWVGTSWKMTKTLREARAWAGGLRDALAEGAPPGVQPFVIPSFTATATVRDELGDQSPVLLGVQNAHWEDEGAWTGEVSVPQAKDAGASMVEIGHSERREHFAETPEVTRLKVAATLRHDLVPLLCVGEPLEVKRAGESAAHILAQAESALGSLDADQIARVIIAYEPIWAIGERGIPATINELEEPLARLATQYAGKVSAILYGGSVGPHNAAELLSMKHLDGLFVGRAAWELRGYLDLLQIAAEQAVN